MNSKTNASNELEKEEKSENSSSYSANSKHDFIKNDELYAEFECIPGCGEEDLFWTQFPNIQNFEHDSIKKNDLVASKQVRKASFEFNHFSAEFCQHQLNLRAVLKGLDPPPRS